jgi:hypothetical protein
MYVQYTTAPASLTSAALNRAISRVANMIERFIACFVAGLFQRISAQAAVRVSE